MSLKNSQYRESLKHEYIFGTFRKNIDNINYA